MPKLTIDTRTHSADKFSLLSSSKLKSRLVFQIWRMLPDESMVIQRSATRQPGERSDGLVVCGVAVGNVVAELEAVDGAACPVVCVDVDVGVGVVPLNCPELLYVLQVSGSPRL